MKKPYAGGVGFWVIPVVVEDWSYWLSTHASYALVLEFFSSPRCQLRLPRLHRASIFPHPLSWSLRSSMYLSSEELGIRMLLSSLTSRIRELYPRYRVSRDMFSENCHLHLRYLVQRPLHEERGLVLDARYGFPHCKGMFLLVYGTFCSVSSACDHQHSGLR